MHVFRILLTLCLYGGSDSLPHLRCCCLRKCHNKQTVDIYRVVLIRNSLNDSLDQHGRLSRTGGSRYEHITVTKINYFLLFGCPLHDFLLLLSRQIGFHTVKYIIL